MTYWHAFLISWKAFFLVGIVLGIIGFLDCCMNSEKWYWNVVGVLIILNIFVGLVAAMVLTQ